MRHLARFAIAASLATALAAPALAQTIPPGQSCGGLFCDLGLLGHKVPVAPDGTPITPASTGPGPATAAPVPSAAEIDAQDPHRLPCRDFLCHAMGQPYADAAPPPAAEPAPVAAPVEPAKPMHKAKRKHVAKAAAPEASAQ